MDSSRRVITEKGSIKTSGNTLKSMPTRGVTVKTLKNKLRYLEHNMCIKEVTNM